MNFDDSIYFWTHFYDGENNRHLGNFHKKRILILVDFKQIYFKSVTIYSDI